MDVHLRRDVGRQVDANGVPLGDLDLLHPAHRGAVAENDFGGFGAVVVVVGGPPVVVVRAAVVVEPESDPSSLLRTMKRTTATATPPGARQKAQLSGLH